MAQRHIITGSILACGILALTSCSAGMGSSSSSASSSGSSAVTSASVTKDVVLLTHESFNVPKDAFADFERKTGYTVTVKKLASAGELANQLVLTKDAPLGDAFYGVDNTFGARVAGSGALADYTPTNLPKDVASYNLAGDQGKTMTPVDHSAVCVNADTAWFAKNNKPMPATLDDLIKPEYKGLLTVPGATGSTGMAFLLATIGAKGESGWQPYWKALVANDIRVDKDWTQAYESSFTAGGGNGKYPLVVSYDTSPAFTVDKAGTSTSTTALLDTCFQQTEYAGVLKGGKNSTGAKALVDYLTAVKFQTLLPDNMYVFPVRSDVKLPAVWEKFAKPATKPLSVDPALIDKNRQVWQTQWQQIASS